MKEFLAAWPSKLLRKATHVSAESAGLLGHQDLGGLPTKTSNLEASQFHHFAAHFHPSRRYIMVILGS
jgi:hypothetical protein